MVTILIIMLIIVVGILVISFVNPYKFLEVWCDITKNTKLANALADAKLKSISLEDQADELVEKYTGEGKKKKDTGGSSNTECLKLMDMADGMYMYRQVRMGEKKDTFDLVFYTTDDEGVNRSVKKPICCNHEFHLYEDYFEERDDLGKCGSKEILFDIDTTPFKNATIKAIGGSASISWNDGSSCLRSVSYMMNPLTICIKQAELTGNEWFFHTADGCTIIVDEDGEIEIEQDDDIPSIITI